MHQEVREAQETDMLQEERWAQTKIGRTDLAEALGQHLDIIIVLEVVEHMEALAREVVGIEAVLPQQEVEVRHLEHLLIEVQVLEQINHIEVQLPEVVDTGLREVEVLLHVVAVTEALVAQEVLAEATEVQVVVLDRLGLVGRLVPVDLRAAVDRLDAVVEEDSNSRH